MSSPTTTATSTATTTSSPSAIAKLVAVAEALTEQRRLSRIANTAGLPISTVHRILQELVAHGWVREGEEHDYVLGPGLMRLAARAADDSDLARAAPPAPPAPCRRHRDPPHLPRRPRPPAL